MQRFKKMFGIKYTKNIKMSSQVFYTIYIMVKFPMNTDTLKKISKCYNKSLMQEFYNNFLDNRIIFIMINLCLR
jgi:hypothetical protein